MSLEAVKSLVSRLSKDPEFKKSLVSSPDAALSQYDLTVEERQAVTKIGVSLGIQGSPEAGPAESWF